MTSIKITRNCQNGEHIFIPALTHTEGRDHYVMAFVCQHCLFHVNERDWEDHIKENFTSEPQEPTPSAASDESLLIPASAGITISEKKGSQQNYPGKRRGPKPKVQGKIQGLNP